MDYHRRQQEVSISVVHAIRIVSETFVITSGVLVFILRSVNCRTKEKLSEVEQQLKRLRLHRDVDCKMKRLHESLRYGFLVFCVFSVSWYVVKWAICNSILAEFDRPRLLGKYLGKIPAGRNGKIRSRSVGWNWQR